VYTLRWKPGNTRCGIYSLTIVWDLAPQNGADPVFDGNYIKQVMVLITLAHGISCGMCHTCRHVFYCIIGGIQALLVLWFSRVIAKVEVLWQAGGGGLKSPKL